MPTCCPLTNSKRVVTTKEFKAIVSKLGSPPDPLLLPLQNRLLLMKSISSTTLLIIAYHHLKILASLCFSRLIHQLLDRWGKRSPQEITGVLKFTAPSTQQYCRRSVRQNISESLHQIWVVSLYADCGVTYGMKHIKMKRVGRRVLFFKKSPNIKGLFYVHLSPNIMGLFYVHKIP